MAENNDEFPETWEELTAQEAFSDLPGMLLPQHFDAVQSALLEVASVRFDKKLTALRDMGAFDDKPSKKYDPEAATVAAAEAVGHADGFFRQIAKDEKTWVEWTQGRDLTSLLLLFATLLRFYSVALGKSNASKTRLQSAE